MTVISPIVYRPMRALFSPRSRSSLPLAAALALLATSALAQQTEPQQTDPVPSAEEIAAEFEKFLADREKDV